MKQQEQIRKYTKMDIISLNCFLFAWITVAITMPSYLLDLLPVHYLIYIIMQGTGYFIFYKLGKYLIANNTPPHNQSSSACDFDSTKRLNDDISCGIPPYNHWRDTNMGTSSTISSSSSYSSISSSSSVYNSLSNH